MLSFIESSLMIMCSDSPSSCSLIFPTGLDTGCSISLPILKVIMAWTSSIFGAGSLGKLSSCTPLGLGSVWEGNLPFSSICGWLFRPLMDDCMVSIFLFCLLWSPSIFLSMELSTFSNLWLIWALIVFCSSTKFPTTLLKFMMACSIGDEVGCCCCSEVDPYYCC